MVVNHVAVGMLSSPLGCIVTREVHEKIYLPNAVQCD